MEQSGGLSPMALDPRTDLIEFCLPQSLVGLCVSPLMSTATLEATSLRIALGGDESGIFETGVPVLAGDALEALFAPARPFGEVGELRLFQADGWVLGAATFLLTSGLEKATRQLYGHIFEAVPGYNLARIWNYVPAINDSGPAGLENYRVFCRGRSLAFEDRYGSEFKTLLPSASAVGSNSAALTVVFAACASALRHVENPLQLSAYEYPDEYGPRAPSFARATVALGSKCATIFISGTAAIRGHATVAPYCTREQLECTLQNLSELSNACGIGATLDRGGSSSRHFKVYLRDAADLPAVAATLEEKLLTNGDRVSYLHADICRAALRVEIEATLFGVTTLRV